MLKKSVKQKGRFSCVRMEAQFHLQGLKIYQTEPPLFIEVCDLQMPFDLNEILPVMHELKWAQMNPNELERAWMSLNKSEWARMSLNELK